MSDLISRQAAIDIAVFECGRWIGLAKEISKQLKQLPSAQPERPEQPESAKEYCAECNHIEMCQWYPYEGCEFRSLPSAQPEIKPIEYRDCANAMLRMWMDNVVTDGEYNRIMAKLNAYWGKDEDETN